MKDAEMSQTWKDYSQPEGKAKSLLVSFWFDRICAARRNLLSKSLPKSSVLF